jgi:hypothetical protein
MWPPSIVDRDTENLPRTMAPKDPKTEPKRYKCSKRSQYAIQLRREITETLSNGAHFFMFERLHPGHIPPDSPTSVSVAPPQAILPSLHRQDPHVPQLLLHRSYLSISRAQYRHGCLAFGNVFGRHLDFDSMARKPLVMSAFLQDSC